MRYVTLTVAVLAMLCVDGARAAAPEGAEVFFRTDFDGPENPFTAEGAAELMVFRCQSVLGGGSLRVRRTQPGGYFGARTQGLSVSGSAGLKVAFCVRGFGMQTVTLNLADALKKDNTTPASPVRLAGTDWRTVVFAVEDFHYNSRPPHEKIAAETDFRSMLFHGREVESRQGNFWLDKLVVYRGHDTQPPGPPGELSATVIGAGRAMLAWKEPADDVCAALYNVYRKHDDGPWEKIAETVRLRYFDAAPPGRCVYRVTAADYDNNCSKPTADVAVEVSKPAPSPPAADRLAEDRRAYADNVRKIHARGRGKVRPDTFLFAGDSITAAHVYTYTLGGWLGRGLTIREGVGTVRTEYGKTHIDGYLAKHRPEFAVIMYGTNDSKDPKSVEQAMGHLGAVIDACVNGGTVPILATIPPRGYDKQKQDGQVRFNTALVELCRQKRVPVSYCFEKLMERELNDVLSDGVHLVPVAGNEAAGEALYATFQHVGFALRETSASW